MAKRKSLIGFFLILTLLIGCAGVAVHDDLNIPAGKIEDGQFAGIRYLFRNLTRSSFSTWC